MDEYEVKSVCFEPWALKIRSYWKYLGGGDCYVLLGDGHGYVILIEKQNLLTGESAHGILVSEPKIISKFRNILWHEMGHLRSEQSDDLVVNEFNADKWAIETALEKGFTRVAEEVILRCVSHMSEDFIDKVYKLAAKKILSHFHEFAQSIVDDFEHSKR